MKQILEIGAGEKPYQPKENEQVIHLDILPLSDIEIVWNLDEFPYPFNDERFDEILCYNILEHISNLIKIMVELRRILKNGGIIKIKVPLFPSIYSITDPTHKHFFTYGTFDYFQYHAPLLYPKAEFKIIKKLIRFSYNKYLSFISGIINLFPVFYSRYFSFIFPANELYVELRK